MHIGCSAGVDWGSTRSRTNSRFYPLGKITLLPLPLPSCAILSSQEHRLSTINFCFQLTYVILAQISHFLWIPLRKNSSFHKIVGDLTLAKLVEAWKGSYVSECKNWHVNRNCTFQHRNCTFSMRYKLDIQSATVHGNSLPKIADVIKNIMQIRDWMNVLFLFLKIAQS